MAASTKSNRLLLLQTMIDDAKDLLREDHLTFIFDLSLLQMVLSLKWEKSHRVEHGLNPFQFRDMEIEQAAYQRNATHDLILQGNMNPSDASKFLKSKVSLPTPDGSNRYIRGMKILFAVLLPACHAYTKWLKNHYCDDMESFRPVFAAYQPQDVKLTYAKGIMHLKHLSLESSEYFKHPQA